MELQFDVPFRAFHSSNLSAKSEAEILPILARSMTRHTLVVRLEVILRMVIAASG
jgi:hypothetical protein